MLWAMIRVAPAACAASTRLRVPSLRRRSLAANSLAILRGLMRAGIEVSWWITASGRAALTAARTAAASKASARTGSAPAARS
jgi:hypothetical protein